MAVTTPQIIITRALGIFNVADPGVTPDTLHLTDGLGRLQDLVRAWNRDGINLYVLLSLAITSTGASTYTFGTGGTFSTTRYPFLRRMQVRVGGVDYDIPPGSQADYGAFPLKSLVVPIPSFFYYEAANPTAALYFGGIPSAGNLLQAVVASPLTDPAALSTSLDLPEGYEEALVYNLALRLAAPFGHSVPQEVRDIAIDAKAAIQRGNDRLGTLDLPAGMRGPSRGTDPNWWRTGGLA